MKLKLFSLLCLMFFLSCSEKKKEKKIDPAEPENVLASLKSRSVSSDEFKAYFDSLNPVIKNNYKTKDAKLNLLNDYLKTIALASQAKMNGADKDPKIIFEFEQMLARRFVEKNFNSKQFPPTSISDEEAQKYFDKNRKYYYRQKMIRIAHIFSSDRQKIKDLVVKAPALLKKKSFGELASEFSEDKKTKDIGGDLNYFTEDEINKKFGPELLRATADFKNIGDITKIISSDDGFHIFQYRGIKPGINKSYSQVELEIKRILSMEKRRLAYDSFIKKVLDDSQIRINKENLE